MTSPGTWAASPRVRRRSSRFRSTTAGRPCRCAPRAGSPAAGAPWTSTASPSKGDFNERTPRPVASCSAPHRAPCGGSGWPRAAPPARGRAPPAARPAGPGVGRVVGVRKGAAADLIGGLNIQGIAFGAKGVLLVSALDDTYTVGTILRYTPRGAPRGTFAGGLSGAFDHVLDTDGDVLVSGSGKVVALAPDGSALLDRASGFAFSTAMFFDRARDELLVLDSGASAIAAVCRDRDGDGVCDVDDDCPTVADAAQADGDMDGVGDACPCAGGTIGKARVTIGNLLTPPGDDTLAIKGEMTVPASPAVDPVTTGMRILVRDGSGTVLNATIPGGAFDELHQAGWKVSKRGTFTYQSALGLLGIRSVTVKPSSKTPGRVTFAVAGKAGSYTADPAHLPLRAFVVLASGAGQCGLATFPGPAPEPQCAYDATRGKVKCG